MSLATIVNAGLVRPERPLVALVLMGGGARTAYQVGVLRALAAMWRLQPGVPPPFPFQILVGTSAGALNVATLAGAATQGLAAFDQLADFWTRLRSGDVYQLQTPAWARWSRIAAAMRLWGHVRGQGAILDTMPLVDTLHRVVSLPGIEAALQQGVLASVAVTASSYTSGVHWTFCHTASDRAARPWQRPGRRADSQPS